MSDLGLTNFGSLTAPIQPLSDFDRYLGSTSDLTKGAGLIGYNSGLVYGAGSAGFALNTISSAIATINGQISTINTEITGLVPYTALSASSGSSLVGFIQASVRRSIAQTLRTKAARYLRPASKTTARSGDGVADDTAALQAARNCILVGLTTPLVSTTSKTPIALRVGTRIRGESAGSTVVSALKPDGRNATDAVFSLQVTGSKFETSQQKAGSSCRHFRQE